MDGKNEKRRNRPEVLPGPCNKDYRIGRGRVFQAVTRIKRGEIFQVTALLPLGTPPRQC